MKPKVTVLLPVFNAEKYIKDAVDSIINQTFGDFELLIYNDASTDGTRSIIEGYSDPRIVLVNSPINQGYLHYLNEGIYSCKGEFIARMDADDIADLNRFSQQVEYLETNPNYGVIGSAINIFGHKSKLTFYPKSHYDCIKELLIRSCFAHPAVMMRKAVLLENNIRYDSNFYIAEDYHLWLQLSEKTKFHNLNQVLLSYRVSGESITVKRKEEQLKLKYRLQLLALNKIANITLDEELEESYLSLLNPYQKVNINWPLCDNVIDKIKESKNDQLIKDYLIELLINNVLILAFYNTEKGISIVKNFQKFISKNKINLPFIKFFKLYIKALFKLRVRQVNGNE